MKIRRSPSPLTVVGLLALFVAVAVTSSERPTPLPPGPTALGGAETTAVRSLPRPVSLAAAAATRRADRVVPPLSPAANTSINEGQPGRAPELMPASPTAAATRAVAADTPADAAATAATGRALAKMDLGLRRVVEQGSTAPVRVILQPVVPAAIGAAALQNLRAAGVEVLGVGTRDGAVVARVAPSQLVWLAADAATAHLSTDAEVAPQQASSRQTSFTDGPVLRDSLGLKKGGGLLIGGNAYNGDKVVVAVIDSGIEPSKDLKASRIIAFYDVTVNGVPAAVLPYDDHGHGTHVAGLIGGSGNRSHARFQGAGSKVKFVGYKVLDKNGAGYTSHVIAALDHATKNRAALGINLINLSLGHTIMESAESDPLVRAVERAVASGIIVVVSAGNRGVNPDTGLPGYGGITSPGNARSAITVGAIDIQNTASRSDDFIQAYSSRGPTWFDAFAKPDIAAPGHRLVAAAATRSTLFENTSLRVAAQDDADEDEPATYLRLSGTSMSAAVTTGVLAAGVEAYWAKDDKRQLSPVAAKAVLQFTAVNMPGENVLTQGAGALNPSGLIRFLSSVPKAQDNPKWNAQGLQPYDTFGGKQVLWNQQILWGEQLLWGDQILWGEQLLWGNQILWGNQLLWGNQILWGDNVVWQNQILWGEQLLWGNALAHVGSSGTTSGNQILWGNVALENLVWSLPPARASRSLSIVDLSVGER